jgi:hypothetical protein
MFAIYAVLNGEKAVEALVVERSEGTRPASFQRSGLPTLITCSRVNEVIATRPL